MQSWQWVRRATHTDTDHGGKRHRQYSPPPSSPVNRGFLPYKRSGSSKFFICCLGRLVDIKNAKCTIFHPPRPPPYWKIWKKSVLFSYFTLHLRNRTFYEEKTSYKCCRQWNFLQLTYNNLFPSTMGYGYIKFGKT